MGREEVLLPSSLKLGRSRIGCVRVSFEGIGDQEHGDKNIGGERDTGETGEVEGVKEEIVMGDLMGCVRVSRNFLDENWELVGVLSSEFAFVVIRNTFCDE